jgi:chromosome segregation ATPase
MDKLTEIKERLAVAPLLRAKLGTYSCVSIANNYDQDVSYLLQLVETQAKRIENLNEESMSNFRAAHERGKEIKRLRKALEEAKDDIRNIDNHGENPFSVSTCCEEAINAIDEALK